MSEAHNPSDPQQMSISAIIRKLDELNHQLEFQKERLQNYINQNRPRNWPAFINIEDIIKSIEGEIQTYGLALVIARRNAHSNNSNKALGEAAEPISTILCSLHKRISILENGVLPDSKPRLRST